VTECSLFGSSKGDRRAGSRFGLAVKSHVGLDQRSYSIQLVTVFRRVNRLGVRTGHPCLPSPTHPSAGRRNWVPSESWRSKH